VEFRITHCCEIVSLTTLTAEEYMRHNALQLWTVSGTVTSKQPYFLSDRWISVAESTGTLLSTYDAKVVNRLPAHL